AGHDATEHGWQQLDGQLQQYRFAVRQFGQQDAARPAQLIKFFNAANPEAPKEVTALTIIRPEDEISMFSPVTTDSIAIPLYTGAD
ncbi:hypothetical protein, partial [Klebsiella variicola]|uniref:hypothetical protein n=1 Tax=Klebsiella variicola TaxID=244366 RepID=UPI002730AED4